MYFQLYYSTVIIGRPYYHKVVYLHDTMLCAIKDFSIEESLVQYTTTTTPKRGFTHAQPALPLFMIATTTYGTDVSKVYTTLVKNRLHVVVSSYTRAQQV